MINSFLHDEKTFYQAFLKDLSTCQKEVIIESPFITTERMKKVWPSFHQLLERGVKVYVMTRDPLEHNEGYEHQSEGEIQKMETLGIQVLLCKGNHHRKLAVIDREILWEGSLNILSQIHSREFMRRLEGGGFAVDLFNYIGYDRFF